MHYSLVAYVGQSPQHLEENHQVHILRVVKSFGFVMIDHLVKVIRDVVHYNVEESFLDLKILSKEIVVNLNAAGMIQILYDLKLPVRKLRILEDLLDSKLFVRSFFDHFENLSEGSFAYRLNPGIVLGSIF